MVFPDRAVAHFHRVPAMCLAWFWVPWGMSSPFKAGVWGHVMLNTCSFYLLVSPCCLQVLGEEGGVQRPRRNNLEILHLSK